MDIFVYSDESGVFDVVHNKYFVFAGVIFIGEAEKRNAERKYIHVEEMIRGVEGIPKGKEIKATTVSNTSKGKLFRSLNNVLKFGVVIEQENITPEIFNNKKSKQRYLDYAYKIAVKKCFEHLLKKSAFNSREIENIYFFIDEHSTATNGRYELQEALEQEFKIGTFNLQWNHFYAPIFPTMDKVKVKYCDSSSKALVRAADIVANRLYYETRIGERYREKNRNFFIITLP